MSGIDFHLLGPMEVRVDDVPIRLLGPAERTALALLLLSPGRTVATTTLIDRLWTPDTLPADPVNALQLRMSKLRRTLGNEVLVRDAAGYRAAVDPGDVDVDRFTAGVRNRLLTSRDAFR